ncbi:MAG: spore germination protein [Clostridia bacterium]|nr:spore germination protein [Clostridia bacterium]
MGSVWRTLKRLWQQIGKMPSSNGKDQGQGAIAVSPSLAGNLGYLKKALGASEDLISRELSLGGRRLAVIYLETMVNRDALQRDILHPLVRLQEKPNGGEANLILRLCKSLAVGDIKAEKEFTRLISGLLDGAAVLMVDGYDLALLLSAEGWEKRPVEEPGTEAALRGPREGFTENLSTNISLIRRRLRTRELRFEAIHLGRRTHTRVVIAYLEGLTLPGILAELRRRLQRIDIDGVLESGYIEELIEEAPFSPFPQVDRTERPDRVTADLLQGRVAILTDGTPFALIIPGNLIAQMQAPDDYYERWPLSIGIRLFRFLGIFIALLLPAIYVAFTTYHQEMLPTPLAIAIASQREAVPYPAVVEALIMQIVFEILIEAGIRLPRVIGPAISIVGALVIGEAAVRASLMSAAMVIVISATAISSFIIPSVGLNEAIRMLRLPLILLAGALGLLGIFAGLFTTLIHLASLRNFGVLYMSPLAPFTWRGQKDVVVRVPWWAMLWRPRTIGRRDLQREKPGQHPQVRAVNRQPGEELETGMSRGGAKMIRGRKKGRPAVGRGQKRP